MAITTYSDTPYNDDFATTDKNYLRILFRPGRSVQARELNQLQSNLQDQIDKFGRHIFKDGDRVLGGYTTYNPNINSVPITFTGAQLATSEQLELLNNITVYKNGTDLSAKVLKVVPFIGANSATYYRLYLSYSGTEDGDTLNTFAEGDVLKLGTDEEDVEIGNQTITADNTIASVATLTNSLESPGYYGGFSQDEGVFFIKGSFVYTDKQLFFYKKALSSTQLSGRCVFDIEESIITYLDDTSLLDNATGSPNENAPGADRYKVSLNLNFIPTSSTTIVESQQQISLLEIKNDGVITPVRTQYSELAKSLAKRTEEESGDYTINPFKLDIREYYNDEAGNRGRYTPSQIKEITGNTGWSDGEAITYGEKRYVIAVEPSTAYIQGYRVELQDKQELIVEKGRESSDLVTKTDYKLQATRPTTFIEGSVLRDDATATSTAQIANLVFRPDYRYHFVSTITGASIGSCRIHSIQNTGNYNAGSASTYPSSSQATQRLYVYDIELNSGYTISDAQGLILENGTSTSTTALLTLWNSDGFSLFGDSNESRVSLIYDLSYDAVSEITNVSHTVQQRFNILSASVVGSTVTLTTSGSSTFISTNPEDYAVIQSGLRTWDDTTGETFVKNVVIASGAQSVTLTLTTATGVAITASDLTVFCPVQIGATLRTKTQTTGVSKTFSSTRLMRGMSFVLNNTDVYAIESITHSLIDSGATDIKDEFILDDGQRATHYDYGTVKYKGNRSIALGDLIVTYSYYTHGTGTYFAPNSYPVSLQDIPRFGGARLSNALDFRPSVTDTVTSAMVYPNSIVECDFDYYLPRKDIVVIDRNGLAKIISGSAAENPISPTKPNNSILLYDIYKPGYVYNLNDIVVTNIDQRRYTMKDIRGLEDRIKNLEYYAALTSLESDAAGRQLQDDNGATRYKNGIFTDSFVGHGVGDTTNDGYRIAIDRTEAVARPMYLSENSRWSYTHPTSDLTVGDQLQYAATKAQTTWNGEELETTTLSHSGKRKNAIVLDFIEKELINQPYASDHISVNPYDVPTWFGNLELSPSSDEWKDITYVPDIVINVEGNNDALLNRIASEPNLLGTEWGEWENVWGFRRIRRGFFRRPRTVRWQRTRLQRDGRFINVLGLQQRQGIQTSLVENFERETINEETLNVTFIPFIRSRKIYFKGEFLKPNTQFYVYFDDINVTEYSNQVTEGNFVQFGGSVASNGGTDVTLYNGQTTSGGSHVITTDASGRVYGSIIIPNNDSLRFRCGTRNIRLTDSSTNNKILELSSADATYYAQGILETRQRTVVSTRVLSLDQSRVTDNREVLLRRVRRRDPIAQTFMIGNEPTGVFISSVDIFFQSIDPNIPIELSIVTVENGIPTQDVIPFSTVAKYPSEVTVDSTRAQSATNFMFDVPVYLEAGTEYAIRLISNSARWRAYIATVGGDNLVAVGARSEKITKNVNLGVLLKSQNASTWTPDQNSDLKFKLNRADFTTDTKTSVFTGLCPSHGGVTYIDVVDGSSGYITGAPTVTITGDGSGATAKAYIGEGGTIESVEILTRGSGYTSAPTIEFSDPDPISIGSSQVDITNNTITILGDTNGEGNSLLTKVKDGQHFIYSSGGGTAIGGLTNGVEYVAKVVQRGIVSTSTSTSGTYGYTIALCTTAAPTTPIDLTGTGNYLQTLTAVSSASATSVINEWRGSTFVNSIQEMILPQANAEYTMFIGSNADQNTTVFANETVYTDQYVRHTPSSGYQGSGDALLKLTTTLSTTDSKITPVIDLDRMSLVSFDNIVNNTSIFETVQNDGESAARYISRRIRLNTPADRVNVILDALRPNESTNIEVYAKLRPISSLNVSSGVTVAGTQSDAWDLLQWVRVPTVDNTEIPVNNEFGFSEMEYQYDASYEFNEVAIKIVFLSSDKTYAPEIKNLRVIATI